jgi:hypothetical protein
MNHQVSTDSEPAAPWEGDFQEPVRSSRSRGALRREQRRSRRKLAVAILITAGLPASLLLSLWRNLTVPFWYNEQWRAYYISISGNWWSALKGDGAPFPAGWFVFERTSASLFGSTELVLRIPTATAVSLGCVLLLLLARRWMPLAGAVVVALVAGLTGTLFLYAVQLSEYEIDAAAVVGIVLFHEVGGDIEDSDWRRPRIYLLYGGIVLACTFSTPAIFIAAPVLLLDVARGLRSRSFRPQAVAAFGAGILILLYLKLFIVPQNALTKSNFWDANFMPHSGIANQIAFVWDGLRGFITGTFTGSDVPWLPELLSLRYSWILSVAFGLLLCIGIVVASRSQRGRTLLVAIGGSLGLTAIASYIRYWPFGFVRTNFYLVPLLILLAGIGASAATKSLYKSVREHRAKTAVARTITAVLAAGICVAVLVAVGLAATYEVGTYRQIRDSATHDAYGVNIDSAVAAVRNHASAGSALVVSGPLAVQGWQYYQYEYTGWPSKTGGQIPPEDAVFLSDQDPSAVSRLINRTQPNQVFLYVAYGAPGIQADIRAISSARVCHQVSQNNYVVSGFLIAFDCSGSAASVHK